MKLLFITTIAQTVNCFLKDLTRLCVERGDSVDIACNQTPDPLDPTFTELGCGIYQIPFSRSVLSPNNLAAYRQLRALVRRNHYDLVHTHTPNASAITRMACRGLRGSGLRVFYTAHGFHFYRGAPKKNWLLFYPAEKLFARFTDVLITINREDEALARKHMKAGKTVYVPGIGLDVRKFSDASVSVPDKRRELGIPGDCFLVLSIGDLNENKNHRTVIRALSMLPKNVHYAVVGEGEGGPALTECATQLQVSDRVHLTGYRMDIPELCHAADLYVLPSIREGLNVSLMEAMASGLPCVVSQARGNAELITDDRLRCDATDAAGFAEAIRRLLNDPSLAKAAASQNQTQIQAFRKEIVLEQTYELYRQAMQETGRPL